MLISGQLNQLRLVSTRAPEVAKTLFDDPAFPWWVQGQVVLIGNAPPMAVSSLENVLELVDPSTNIDAHQLAALGVLSCLRPGADGAVAAVVSSSETVHTALINAFELEARRDGFEWLDLSDLQFVDAVAERWQR
ncbi:MAG: hypothetical protein JW940_00945 [Polyangiaceae bacterium]|nr:hypothetical protein [Polyangiaceae bacterium]